MADKNLVLRIIMLANDKASKQFDKIRISTDSLSHALSHASQELKAIQKNQKTLNRYAKSKVELQKTADTIKNNGYV